MTQKYDYLKEQSGERIQPNADLFDPTNMALLQIDDLVDVYSPITKSWHRGIVIKPGDGWVETMMGDDHFAVLYTLSDAPVWVEAGFVVRSATTIARETL